MEHVIRNNTAVPPFRIYYSLPQSLLSYTCMKLAIVFDDLKQFGGAEKLLLAACEIWPSALVFTAHASKKWQLLCKEKGITLIASFMQRLPFIYKLNKLYALFGLHTLAYELFDLSGFDVVLSISARFAHGVITRPETRHICYMNSPGRPFWEPHLYFKNSVLRLFLSPLLLLLRLWDYTAAQRVDAFVANSDFIQQKIRKYYGKKAVVIYPFVDELPSLDTVSTAVPYYLVISRLVPWKRIDIVVQACTELDKPLKIIGIGSDQAHLKKLAGDSNIEFCGFVSDADKFKLLSNCIAVIIPQREDFGIVPLEAMLLGVPIIAYRAGGALETVLSDKTGEFFEEQTVDSLKAVLQKFNPQKYNRKMCVSRARQFSKAKFTEKLTRLVNDVYLKGL